MPAFAAIDRLRATAGLEVVYIGSRTGIERQAAARAGVPYHAIRTGKLRRSRRRLGVVTWRNLADVLEVLWGTGQSLRLLVRMRPAVVLATGGFVTPVVWAARARRVPIVLHEQTVQFGLANRLCAPAATSIGLSTPLSLGSMQPRWRRKSTVTGNPVRAAVLSGDADRAGARLGLVPGIPTVLVTGGALGSEVLNQAVHDALPQLLRLANVIHQCGAASALTTTFASLAAAHRGDPVGAYALSEFLEADLICDAYVASSLVVCRSSPPVATSSAGSRRGSSRRGQRSSSRTRS
jgi:UDP-N-acetylglucosamine--N-acetylmuramyl-(pentapeptide) pyrophosphoryl-undecaprenol N-acetylglucosamine transferase